jgi:hypothetical protein
MESRSRQVSLRELSVVVTMLAICFAAVTQGMAAASSPLLFGAIILAQIASPLLILERIASRSNGWITAALVGCYAALICVSLGLLLNEIPSLEFDSLLRSRRGC